MWGLSFNDNGYTVLFSVIPMVYMLLLPSNRVIHVKSRSLIYVFVAGGAGADRGFYPWSSPTSSKLGQSIHPGCSRECFYTN